MIEPEITTVPIDFGLAITTTHHSFWVENWKGLPGGVRITQIDDDDQIVMLLRPGELSELITKLQFVQDLITK